MNESQQELTGTKPSAYERLVDRLLASPHYGERWARHWLENPTQVYDIHATMLHLMGIDHTKLTFLSNGIDRRLTDVHGHVIEELLV